MRTRRMRAVILVHLAIGSGACAQLSGLDSLSIDSCVDACDAGDAGMRDALAEGPSRSSDASQDAGRLYSAEVLLDRPLAYWRLGELSSNIAYDSSGANIDGVYGAAVVRGAPGLLSRDPDLAASFPAQRALDSIVRVSPRPALQPSSAVSLECWVQSANPSAADTRLLSYGADQTDPFQAYAISLQSGLTLFYMAGMPRLYGGLRLTANEAHHVVVTYDGAVASIYLDGAIDLSRPQTGALIYAADEGLGIGGGYSGTGGQFTGTIDEVAIYDHALPSERVFAHYAAGQAK